MGGTRFMVQWEEHPSHLATRLGQLLEHQTLVDVTLMCNTHTLRVHRAVLAACSPYFETILQRQLGMYPLIVLKDMQFSVLKSLIEFMYCGETSVTEDNLSALLQAAKFFQVKGLSAMTKEALGLTSATTPKAPTTVNGEAARKAFVGRSKRVGMQQTFVASGLKSVSAATSLAHGAGGDAHTPTAGKTIFQTTPKSVPVRQDAHHHQQQQQQQTDTAQLLLSLSGSEFPKQTFHTVSKNVRFHHGVTPGGAVTVEPSRTCSLESSIVKNKETTVRSEVIDRVPVVTPNSGVKSTSVVLPATLAEKGAEQQVVSEKAVEGTKEDLTSQMFYVEDGPCKRGRPLKRQMNLVFQEKVMTDADMALQKEAEASRKALEMLQQEMSTGDEVPAAGVTQATESVQQKIVPVKQPLTKGPASQQINNMMTATSRILPKESIASSKIAVQKANIAPVTAVSTPEASNQNVIYQVTGNTIPAIDSNSNETNIVYQLQEGVISGQEAASGTNIVYQVADNTVLAGQDASGQNIIYQMADNANSAAEGGNNTNIIYQVTDSSNTGSGTTMSQYMEVLKEAGLPSDVPILLESSDGSYVTVNEEVLMNIMNGGMIQVSDGSIVGGEGVQFIVQEVQEMNEGQAENTEESTEMNIATPAANETENAAAASETLTPPVEEMQVSESSDNVPAKSVANTNAKHSTYKPAKGQQIKSSAAKDLPVLVEKESPNIVLVEKKDPNVVPVEKEGPNVAHKNSDLDPFHVRTGKHETNVDATALEENTPMEVEEPETTNVIQPPTHSDEVITGDSYGEEAMEGFAVVDSRENTERSKSQPDTNNFTLPEENSAMETDTPLPPAAEATKETKSEEAPSNGGMSVEQALQAMMGEGSDTEMEVCANTDADGTTKIKPVISHREAKGRSTPNEGSIDEETEELRLVLSPEDDSIKVEDESQSAGEGSINDSFTLALSSPDSTGNEKAPIESDQVISSEGSCQPEKTDETINETTDVNASNLNDIEDARYPQEASITNEFNSTAPSSTELSKQFNEEGSTENSSSLEMPAAETEKVASPPGSVVAQLDDSTTLDSGEEILLPSSDVHVPSPHTEHTETENLKSSVSPLSHEQREDVAENVQSDTAGSDKVENADMLPKPAAPEANININDDICPESDITEPIRSPVEAICNSQSSSEPEIAKSLPILSENESNATDAEHTSEITVPSSEKEFKTEDKSSEVSELPSTEPKERVADNLLSDIITNDGKEQEMDAEAEIAIANSENEISEKQINEAEEVKATEENDRIGGTLMDSEENKQLATDDVNADKNGVVGEGSVTSPSKDIPYAVGLLPLKTALEKLQAMPEYHPRKTRSASSGKESANDAPAGRLKRKMSAATENSEKKLKSDDGDCSYDNESNLPVISDDFDEGGEEHSASESCAVEGKTSVESTIPQEPMETAAVENKMETLPSMMELVTDSSEAV